MVVNLFPGFMSMIANYYIFKMLGWTNGPLLRLAMIAVYSGGAGLGYRLSVPNGNGGWRTLQGFTAGGSYTYDKTADGTPPLVKIEWRVQKPFVMVVR